MWASHNYISIYTLPPIIMEVKNGSFFILIVRERVIIIVISQKAVAVAGTAVALLVIIVDFRCAGPAEHKADLEVDGWAVKSCKVGPETSVGLNIKLVCCQRPLYLLRFFLRRS